MNMQKTTISILDTLRQEYGTAFNFEQSDVYYWSAQNQTVYYDPSRLDSESGIYTLIHELGHALLGHKTFGSGAELLTLEVEAWQKAKEIASKLDISIASEHIEHCLDSYRDWLHRRSTCPTCKTISTEVDENTYRCFNCSQRWTVPTDQRTRCYRLKVSA